MYLIHGVGFNDRTRPSRAIFDGISKNIKEYALWKGMLNRCYSKKIHEKRQTYIGCGMSENFKLFSYFHDWCQNQIGFNREKYQLDKDILVKGNKIYSEDTCVFVPYEVNLFLTKTDAKRGLHPIGVNFNKAKGMFKSYIHIHRKQYHLGFFNDEVSAFNAYKKAKENHIKVIAEKYKDDMDARAYKALMDCSIDITD